MFKRPIALKLAAKYFEELTTFLFGLWLLSAFLRVAATQDNRRLSKTKSNSEHSHKHIQVIHVA